MRKPRAALLPLMLILALTPVAADEDAEIADALMRQLVDFTAKALKEWDPNQPGLVPHHAAQSHDHDPAYALAFLYKTPHRLNPYHGKTEIRDTAIAIGDRIAARKMTAEWPFYLLCQVYGLLEDEIPEKKRREWKAYANHYITTRGMRPFGYTAPNHESYNTLAILRAGQVFGEKSWEAHGTRLMHQLIKMQTELGYFDEGKHHGPSMQHNQYQLAAMLLFHDYSKDEAALEASRKLAEFMIRYSFPDGSPISAFDGRHNFHLGYRGTLTYGTDRWPMGKELNRRIYRARKQRGILDVSSPHYSFTDRFAYFGTFFIVDEYRGLRKDAPAAPLPQDRNGYRMVEKGPSFHGGVTRQHDWMVALSAIDSHVPVYTRGPYQLERQSRLDIWHPDTGLVIGGGPSRVGAEVPLANFLLLTGHAGVDASFGHLEGGSVGDRQAIYFPRAVDIDVRPDRQTLQTHFGHGDFGFTVRPRNSARLDLTYNYDILAAKKAFVQVPLILFHDSNVHVDGKSFDSEAGAMVEREIVIQNPTTQSTVKISAPRGRRIFLRPATYPLRWYGGGDEEHWYRPYYRIALLSIALDPPVGQGSGTLVVEIAK